MNSRSEKACADKAEQQALKARYAALLAAEVWKDQKMVDYCVKKTARIVELSDGALICIEKPAIRTRFCFGYHANVHYTEEISTAEEAAAHAAKSQEYFKTKNLESMDAMLKALENSEAGIRPQYTGTAESTRICELVFPEPWEPASPGYRRLLPEDREKIREAYRTERAVFAARLDAYLKRYGLSKVETWTYWLEE